MKQKLTWADVGFFLLTLLLSTGFSAYLSVKRVTDPFLYYDVAFVKSIQPQPQMIIPEMGPYASLSLAPGREMLMVQFTNMMGIEPEVLQFLPLGAIFVSITLYVLARRLLGSSVAACLVTLYLTFNLSHAAGLYSIFAYAFVLSIFLGAIIMSKPLFEKHRPAEILISLLLFVGAHFIHHTMTAWIILFLFGAQVAMWIHKRFSRESSATEVIPVYYLLLAFVVIYFAFNQVFYSSFLPWIGSETLEGAVQRFVSYSAVGTAAASRSPYAFARSSSVGLVSTFTLVIILLPTALGFLSDLWQILVRHRSPWKENWHFLTAWGIIVMGFVDALVYATRGSVSTKSFSLVFTLVMLLYLRRTGKELIFYGMAVLLFMTSLAKIAIFYENSYVISSGSIGASLERVQPSAEWLNTHVSLPRYGILADLNLYGKYLVSSVGGDHQPIVQGYTTEQFEHTLGVSTEEWVGMPHIVAIDLSSSEPTIGFLFERLDPLRDYSAAIRGNLKLTLIYDDGAIWLARTTRE
jgi:hypothetical protein